MEMVKLTINGREVRVEKGTTILEAATKIGVKIPTLCYLKDINEVGVCRVCVVEVEGSRNLQPSCIQVVSEGMVVHTDTPRVRDARRTVVELILSNHPQDCLTCERNLNCELQNLAEKMGIRGNRFTGERNSYPADDSSAAIVRNPEKCILCRRCVSVCHEVQGVKALSPSNRGFKSIIGPAFSAGLGEVACVQCGQCALVCPTGAIVERSAVGKVWAALADPEKHVIVQTAPAIRATIGEEFGLEPGTLVTGRLAAALRMLGFDRVFDTDFAADLTIIEEGHELLERMREGGRLPLITSCSPAWIKFCEHFYPDLLDNLSTCKSPHEMFGALAKTYYAEKEGIDPAKIFVVSVMPCTAKKFEIERPEMTASGYKDVDAVLTTRELAGMIREAGIDFLALKDENFDEPLGISTGAGVIFGATGGVMEAALRTVYEVVTGKELVELEFADVRGLEGVKEAAVDLDGKTVKVAVAHGLGNARRLLDAIKEGTDYTFVEIMACPGGCIGGGGSPIPTDTEIRARRIEAIYREDERMPLRKSHDNPAVKKLYEEYLLRPLGEKSHRLLHTHYRPRPRYDI